MAKAKAPAKRKAGKPAKGAKRPPGRPSLYTPVLAERICSLIAQGHSKRKIETMEGMPCRETIDEWLLKYEGFASHYARACEIRAEGFAEELIEIADRTDLDAQDKRVRVDARKWVASKLLPRKYGEAVTLRGDKDNPIETRTRVDLSEAELLAIAAGSAALDG